MAALTPEQEKLRLIGLARKRMAEAQQQGSAPAAQMQEPKAPLNQSPFRGGVRGEKTLAGTAKPFTPEDLMAQNKGIDDFARGMAIGAPASVIGMAGDIESLGRLPLSLAGVSRDPMLPTTTEVGNYIRGGPPQSRQEEGGFGIGGMVGPPLASAGMRQLGKVAGYAARGNEPSQIAQEARASGYVIPPNMAQENPSLISKGLSALGGRTKIQQGASAKNQAVTNAIVTKELGLSPNTPLNKESFNAVREQAGKAYEAVKQAMPEVSTDLTFASEVKNLGGRASDVAQEFPELANNSEIENLVSALSKRDRFSTKAAIELVRRLRADATDHFKAFDDPAKKALGGAQKAAANAIEDLIERRLGMSGNATLMNDLRQARTLIAKTHDVEAATNLATGEVSARDLARMMDKGKPFTGGLSAVAKMGAAFPKAAQDVPTFGGTEGLSVTDAILGGASASMGRPDLLSLILARPAARGAVLSNPYQNAVLGARNANVPGASAITPNLLRLMSAQGLQRLIEGRNEPR
jgi:hypothetical protein